ncbi:MAG: UDP-N-acetylmuramoyl-tripeptide--D-alanyl-D-alanine ligase [Hyphomicrobiaceae bacterium]
MTRSLWTLGEIITASCGRLDLSAREPCSSDLAAAIAGISIDTRSLAPGDLFVPLTDARDGHEFVTAAFERGAEAALVRDSYVRRPGDGALIRVDDPLRALERIGMAARARLSDTARVVAVTGSAGKTGTKEMLRACLKVCASSPDKVHAPEKSFNNHWGVPLTLARMPADTEFGIYEIGMNHAGEIRPLAKMVRPHIAIITNVLPVHVGNFEDGEIGVANAKAEIFEGLEGGGTAIILRASPHFELLRKAAGRRHARIVTFGRHNEADIRLINVSAEQADGSQIVSGESHWTDAKFGFALGMLGDHLAVNSLAVVAALEALGCDAARATKAMASVRSAAGRGAREQLGAPDGQILLLDESYNANPASMAAALANLAQTDNGGRRVAILGDMLELGTDSIRYHIGLQHDLEPIDLVLCCGASMRHLYDELATEKKGAWAPSSIELIPHVLQTLRVGDAVMVKGSLGSRMAPIVEAIRKRFSGN